MIIIIIINRNLMFDFISMKNIIINRNLMLDFISMKKIIIFNLSPSPYSFFTSYFIDYYVKHLNHPMIYNIFKNYEDKII